jgi:hypothetical protein
LRGRREKHSFVYVKMEQQKRYLPPLKVTRASIAAEFNRREDSRSSDGATLGSSVVDEEDAENRRVEMEARLRPFAEALRHKLKMHAAREADVPPNLPETDTRWGIDTETKVLKFAPTWKSAAFLHNPQFCFPLLDVAPARNAYRGGNGTEFFKLGSAEYNQPRNRSSPVLKKMKKRKKSKYGIN